MSISTRKRKSHEDIEDLDNMSSQGSKRLRSLEIRTPIQI